jgi:hypothetical protein
MKSVVPISTATFGSPMHFRVGIFLLRVGGHARKFNWEVRISLSGRQIFGTPKKQKRKKI